MTHTNLLAEIDALLAELSKPTSSSELEEGWDDALKARWRDWFSSLKENLQHDREVPAGWGILRSMDFDGVSRSSLAAQANRIGAMMDGQD